jgi:DnaJ-domain-containing protein 1
VLDDLDVPTLIALLSEIDEDSIPLLAAYLDRRQPRWREHAPGDAGPASGSRPWRGSKMTEEEAYQILGVQPGATAQDIARAHRSLMKKLHPDQGGRRISRLASTKLRTSLFAAVAEVLQH